MNMIKRLARWWGSMFFSLVLVLAVNGHVFAAYGSGAYGSCVYSSCSSTAAAGSSTVGTLPSGLQVAINLSDGQSIPLSGYTITVTPLNGAGSSFKEVNFIVDGVQLAVVQPDNTGTAKWFWDPQKYPGTHITVTVIGQDGSTLTKSYTVRIAGTSVGASSSSTPASTGAAAAIQHFVKSLPKVVVYGFPYLLFILLGCSALLLLVLTYREVIERKAIQERVKQARSISDTMSTFLKLASHYLRTPLTLLNGGVDTLAESHDPTEQFVAKDLRGAVEQLTLTVEALIDQSRSAAAATLGASATKPSLVSLWFNPLLFVPVTVTALLVFVSDYLVNNVGKISIGSVNVFMQISSFFLAVVFLYVALRQLQLRHQDVTAAAALLQEELVVSKAREDFIYQSAASLRGSMQQVSALTARLADSKAASFVREGERRFKLTLDKFAIAAKLRTEQGAAMVDQADQKDTAGIAAQVQALLSQKIAEKQIKLTITVIGRLHLAKPELFAFVITNVLDNAIAYSSEGGVVTVSDGIDAKNYILTVVDHGSGIPEDKLKNLFEPFSKVEGADVFNHEGMGFSLYLDRLIMTYLDGDITIDSDGRTGTTVRLYLPLAAVSSMA